MAKALLQKRLQLKVAHGPLAIAPCRHLFQPNPTSRTQRYSPGRFHRPYASPICPGEWANKPKKYSTTSKDALEWSWIEGPKEPRLEEGTVGEVLDRIVHKHGDRPAVIAHKQGVTLSFSQLSRLADELAGSLYHKVGVRKGDCVCVQLGNSVEHVVFSVALYYLGAVLVPLNPAFTPVQVQSALNHLKASFLVVSRVTRRPYGREKSSAEVVEQALTLKGADGDGGNRFLRAVISVDNRDARNSLFGNHSSPKDSNPASAEQSDEAIFNSTIEAATLFSNLPNSATPKSYPRTEDPTAVVNIQFTSGTTSAPKAACLTHRNIVNNGKSIGDRLRLGPDDAICCPPPLFHCFGCILGLMATLTHGTALVFPSEAFHPEDTLEAAALYDCSGLYGVPTMFVTVLQAVQQASEAGRPAQLPSRLRTGIAAGSTVPAELMARLGSTLGLTELCVCYGMTETSPVSTMTEKDDPLERRLDSVGRPLPHLSVKVVSPLDRTKVLPVGEPGELAVSGYSLMAGYAGDPDTTGSVMLDQAGDNPNEDAGKWECVGAELGSKRALVPRAGSVSKWMFTGDEAVILPDGFVRITGRIKDLIIRGGENIHPLEIENCLLASPSVVDSYVVGVPDSQYGEVVVAFVQSCVPNRSEEDEAAQLKAWVREKLSSHLVPAHVFVVEDFPKTASGKVQKFKLREEAMARLGLQ